MVVELLNFDLPLDLVFGTVLDLDGKVSSVVELSELGHGDGSGSGGTGSGGDLLRFLSRLVKGGVLSAHTLTLLESS